jgi:hypothetical protein
MVESLLIAEPFRPVRPVLESIGEYNVALFDPFDPIEDEDDDVCPECEEYLDEEGECPNGCEIDTEILDDSEFDDEDYFDDLDDVDYFDDEEDDDEF